MLTCTNNECWNMYIQSFNIFLLAQNVCIRSAATSIIYTGKERTKSLPPKLKLKEKRIVNSLFRTKEYYFFLLLSSWELINLIAQRKQSKNVGETEVQFDPKHLHLIVITPRKSIFVTIHQLQSHMLSKECTKALMYDIGL